MIPTPRLAGFAFVGVLVALAASFFPELEKVLWALDGFFVLLVAIDALLARGTRLEAERAVPKILSVGRANTITLTIRNRSGRPLDAAIVDDPLTDAAIDTALPMRTRLPARATVQITYEVTPKRRGERTFGAVTVRYPSILGLVARQESILLPETVEVYPDVHTARGLELLRRQGREDAKMGSLRVRGGDTEFERLRPYQIGDEIRHIDWRATARKDDLVVRQFQAESNQNVLFLLDAGRGMCGESESVSFLDHALNATLLTSDVALRGGDRAGLLVFDASPKTFLRPGAGLSTGRKITQLAASVEPSMEATDYAQATAFAKANVKGRSLFIVLTNLLEPRGARELAAALKGLLPNHLPLCVLLRDTEVEGLLQTPLGGRQTEGAYVRAAAAKHLLWREKILRDLRRSGVLVLDCAPKDLTPSLVKRFLEVKARRLL